MECAWCVHVLYGVDNLKIWLPLSDLKFDYTEIQKKENWFISNNIITDVYINENPEQATSGPGPNAEPRIEFTLENTIEVSTPVIKFNNSSDNYFKEYDKFQVNYVFSVYEVSRNF